MTDADLIYNAIQYGNASEEFAERMADHAAEARRRVRCRSTRNMRPARATLGTRLRRCCNLYIPSLTLFTFD